MTGKEGKSLKTGGKWKWRNSEAQRRAAFVGFGTGEFARG